MRVQGNTVVGKCLPPTQMRMVEEEARVNRFQLDTQHSHNAMLNTECFGPKRKI